jgi:GNAT superfamily N-acetyltransferase
MSLEPGEWRDILKVLHHTYEIWSPGLDRQSYYHYIRRQMNHPWSRRNYTFLIYRDGSGPVASCKLYRLQFSSRGKLYRFAGVGAVFTQPDCRGMGYAQKMINELIDRSRSDGADGMLLFTDIGPQFYERFGFRPLGCNEFFVHLPGVDSLKSEPGAFPEVDSLQALEPRVCPVELAHVALLDRHYRRWLRGRPFGVARCEQYWSFKLGREIFLHANSEWSWPRMELVMVDDESTASGYALIEYSAKTLRALEIVGPLQERVNLWRNLFSLALKRGARRIRAWEGLFPDFARNLKMSPREWGCPMILPLARDVEGWTECNPCPILELDHL